MGDPAGAADTVRPGSGTTAASMLACAAMLVAGSVVSTLRYAVTIQARLGLGPLHAVQDGVARHAGITIGHSVMVVGVALGGSIGAGTVVTGALIGPSMHFWLRVIGAGDRPIPPRPRPGDADRAQPTMARNRSSMALT